MFIQERIIEVIDSKSITPYRFCKDLGFSMGYLDKRGAIGTDKYLKIIEYFPDVCPIWLLTGEGEMLINSNETTAIKRNDYVNEPQSDYGYKGIPLVSCRAVGGFGNSSFSIENRDVKDYYIIPKFKDKQIDFMIEVEGSSMYPKYNSGDVVACRIINEATFIQWNKTHVISTHDQGILIKRLQKGTTDRSLILASDNKSYGPFEVEMTEISGIAIVIGVIKLE